MNKGFTLTFPNKSKLSFSKSVINPKQKSYDILFNDGNNNCWYKIGIIRDMDTLNKIWRK